MVASKYGGATLRPRGGVGWYALGSDRVKAARALWDYAAGAAGDAPY